VHHQLGKVIQMNQLDATMIYWSIRSAQHAHAPDDGQNIARNMLSWSYRSLNHCCI